MKLTKTTVNTTSISYCAECRKNFADNETCHFTWYENACFCDDCKQIMNSKVKESYLDWQERIYKG